MNEWIKQLLIGSTPDGLVRAIQVRELLRRNGLFRSQAKAKTSQYLSIPIKYDDMLGTFEWTKTDKVDRTFDWKYPSRVCVRACARIRNHRQHCIIISKSDECLDPRIHPVGFMKSYNDCNCEESSSLNRTGDKRPGRPCLPFRFFSAVLSLVAVSGFLSSMKLLLVDYHEMHFMKPSSIIYSTKKPLSGKKYIGETEGGQKKPV